MAEKSPGTLRAHLVQRLHQDILAGKYRPGDRLNESSIARSYNISRIPVREALFQLRESGLVMLRERRGMFVTTLSEEEVRQINSVRVLLEAEAFSLARQNVTADAARSLTEHVRRMESLHLSLTDAAAMDLSFHRKVWALSGNKYLQRVLDPIATLLFAHNTLVRVGPQSREWVLNHHRKLLDVLLNRDETDIREALIDHFKTAIFGPISHSRPSPSSGRKFARNLGSAKKQKISE